MEIEKIGLEIQKNIMTYGLDILAAGVIFMIGKWLAVRISEILEKLLLRARMDETLAKFTRHLTYVSLLVFAVIAALAKLGIETASFIAVLGAAGFAVGMALQGSLSNFAAGILILVFRPFKVGDVVTLAGINGKVQEIQIFNTLLCSEDNVQYIIPNSQATSGSITNITAHDKRRLDFVIGVSYAEDLKKTKQVLYSVLASDPGVLKDPAPLVAVLELAESSVNFCVRPWVRTSEYGDVRFRLLEKIKETLDVNGITIPFPQREIHVKSPVNARDAVAPVERTH